MMTRKVISVILGALMILAGVYCFFTPVETSAMIPFVLGIVMIGDGIGRIVTWFDIRDIVRQSAWVLVSAVVSLIFGLMLAFSPVLQMSVGVFVVLLTGWWILALGIIRIVHAFHLLKLKKESDGFGRSYQRGVPAKSQARLQFGCRFWLFRKRKPPPPRFWMPPPGGARSPQAREA